jgi:hypothetical protein
VEVEVVSARVATAGDVLSALRNGPLREPAHAWLYEVRNQTGYGRRQRYADALVVSVWPSRGIWIAGVEVKVSRSDWRKELDSPEKSAEIQRFCDFWWVAAPEGVVEPAEVPETWGHFVMSGKKAQIAKQAPALNPEPLSREFVASILRNQSQRLAEARNQGHSEGHAKACETYDTAKIDQLQEELRAAKRESSRFQQQLKWKESELSSVRQAVADFEDAAGIEAGIVMHRMNGLPRRIGAHYKAATLLAEMAPGALAGAFEDVAKALRDLEQSEPLPLLERLRGQEDEHAL